MFRSFILLFLFATSTSFACDVDINYQHMTADQLVNVATNKCRDDNQKYELMLNRAAYNLYYDLFSKYASPSFIMFRSDENFKIKKYFVYLTLIDAMTVQVPDYQNQLSALNKEYNYILRLIELRLKGYTNRADYIERMRK